LVQERLVILVIPMVLQRLQVLLDQRDQ
jgi:hypothetical protein